MIGALDLPRTAWALARAGVAPGLVALLLTAGTPARGDDALTSVRFRFRPPGDAGPVTVAGTFNDWNPGASPMADPDGDGIWEVTLRISPGTHQYKFVVGGTDWFTDESAAAFTDDGFGGRNSVVEIGEEPITVGDAGAGPGADEPPPGVDVVFRYRPRGPHVNAVSVAGTFDGWNAATHVMSDPDGDGLWEVTIRLEPGDHAYQIVIDGERWIPDPLVEAREEDGFGGWRTLLHVGEDGSSAGGR